MKKTIPECFVETSATTFLAHLIEKPFGPEAVIAYLNKVDGDEDNKDEVHGVVLISYPGGVQSNARAKLTLQVIKGIVRLESLHEGEGDVVSEGHEDIVEPEEKLEHKVVYKSCCRYL